MAAEAHSQNGDAVHPASSPVPQSTQSAELAKEEVGWYFVERYYNTLSKNPEKLYLLYNKRSQFVAGVEEEKVHVSIGLKAIDDRVKELDYQDCKVRITNVDSQSSDVNIVVQVIGEMTNEAKPHRKFCQTFVLAPQPHGYFLLNDILRFIADEDDEPIESQPSPVPSTKETDTNEQTNDVSIDHEHHDESSLSKALEQQTDDIVDESQAANGNKKTDDSAVNVEVPAHSPTVASEQVSNHSADEETNKNHNNEPELSAGAEVSPVEPDSQAKPNAAISKPAVPLSWAQRIGAGNSAKTNTSATPAATTGTLPPKSAVKPPSQPVTNTQTLPNQASTPGNVPARQPSPTDSAQDGSQGGWQTAGADHSKTKSRSGPSTADNNHVRAYVKNVFQSVTTEALKAELSKYGELAYFDVSRQKNSAFVEFSSVEAFRACIADNPHRIGDDSIVVEERRPGPSFGTRGPNRGGRGGSFDGRQGPNRGGFAGKDNGSPRGAFNGPRGGRGGPSNVSSRGRPQAV